jgi:threonine/homoserine/homoserine lactone efflux protein
MGRSLAGVSCSALMLMVAIVNRGVAAGSGDGLGYGTNCLHLWTNYVTLLLKRATRPESFGILEVSGAAVMVWSILGFLRGAWQNLQVEDKKSTRRK